MSSQPQSQISPDLPQIQRRIDHVFQLQHENKRYLKNTTAAERIARLKKIYGWVSDNKDRIREAIHQDFRKPAPEVDSTEIFMVLSEIRHTIKHLKKWMKPRRIPRTLAMLTTRSWIRCEAKGVVLIISPWNFPFMLAVDPLVSALGAGNCVILKPSELSPHTSRLVSEMAKELFPENEAAVFEGDKQVASELLKKPFDHIYFTGSARVGKIVMKAAADHLAGVTLEMGGKNPLIVDETAHIPDAAKKIVVGKFVNAGQMCISPDYVFVHERKYDALVNALKEEVQKIYGESHEVRIQTRDYARIIDQGHYDRLRQLISNSRSNGANIIVGGETDDEQRYISPTILTHVNPDSPLMQEEIFGPLLPVMSYASLDEVIDAINSYPTPLTVSIFSNSRKNIRKIMGSTSSGNCTINEVGVQFLHLNFPFGGKKESGMGSSHGFHGFKTFSHERAVMKQSRFSLIKLIYPPYTKTTRRIIDFVVKYF